MKAIHFVILASLLGSCTSREKNTDGTSSQDENKKEASLNCYRYATATDTIFMQLHQAGDSITGTLVYALKEKDRNQGRINGKMTGDILVADYIFISEGIESTRQIAFKKDGDSFIEGYGDLKNPGALDFNGSFKLEGVSCP